jgi:hypothetical protein
VLLHLLIYPFTVNFLVISFLLACLYGILYVWVDSIFLVGTMHAVFNLTPQLLNQWPPDVGMMSIHSVALALVAILYRKFKKEG